MSVASANVFALLDDEGTVDVGELAAKIPVAAKEAPVKKSDDGTFGISSESSVVYERARSSCKRFSLVDFGVWHAPQKWGDVWVCGIK